MNDTAGLTATIEQQLREMNEALLVSSVRQHELTAGIGSLHRGVEPPAIASAGL